MSPPETQRINHDNSNIPIVRRESVSTVASKFCEKNKEKNIGNNVLDIVRKIQLENLQRDKNYEEDNKILTKMQQSIDAVLDLNIKLEIEIKKLRDDISKNEAEKQKNQYSESLTVLLAALSHLKHNHPTEGIPANTPMVSSNPREGEPVRT